MSKTMLINAADPEETRIAVVEGGRLEELYVERAGAATRLGNVYQARVTNVEPSIGAAFVDLGSGRSGFLHASDTLAAAAATPLEEENGDGGDAPEPPRPPNIAEVLQPGQEILVQVTKDGIGSKGPALSMQVSLPGRYLVLLPFAPRIGVSRRITDEETRRELRDAVAELEPPAGMGYIVRTAGADRTKRELAKDMKNLLALWEDVQRRAKAVRAPALLYRESDLVTRTIRDAFTSDVERLIVDADEAERRAREFLAAVMPRFADRIVRHEGTAPLFHAHGVEGQIEALYGNRVELPSGGSIVVEQTEALVAIDVNSGRFREESDLELTAYRTDLEAVPEIARQLRLRDLGGVVIIDFIDMREPEHIAGVEQALKHALRRDRARIRLGRIGPFGMIELTRQRVRESLLHATHERCVRCRGTGRVHTVPGMALRALREVQFRIGTESCAGIEVVVAPPVAGYLLNRKRRHLSELEDRTGRRVSIRAEARLGADELVLRYLGPGGEELGSAPLRPPASAQAGR